MIAPMMQTKQNRAVLVLKLSESRIAWVIVGRAQKSLIPLRAELNIGNSNDRPRSFHSDAPDRSTSNWRGHAALFNGPASRAARLFSDEDHDSGDQGQDREKNAGGTETEAGNAHDADENEIDGKQEHAEVLRNHGAILTGWEQLSRANLRMGVGDRRGVGEPARRHSAVATAWKKTPNAERPMQRGNCADLFFPSEQST